jgi:hypothetical protein
MSDFWAGQFTSMATRESVSTFQFKIANLLSVPQALQQGLGLLWQICLAFFFKLAFTKYMTLKVLWHPVHSIIHDKKEKPQIAMDGRRNERVKTIRTN